MINVDNVYGQKRRGEVIWFCEPMIDWWVVWSNLAVVRHWTMPEHPRSIRCVSCILEIKLIFEVFLALYLGREHRTPVELARQPPLQLILLALGSVGAAVLPSSVLSLISPGSDGAIACLYARVSKKSYCGDVRENICRSFFCGSHNQVLSVFSSEFRLPTAADLDSFQS